MSDNSKNIKNKLKHIFLNKYVIVVLIFVVIFVFLDNYNLISYFKTSRKIKDLDRKIEYYENEININKHKLNELETVGENLDKVAREQYLFKKDNEDVFIIEKKKK